MLFNFCNVFICELLLDGALVALLIPLSMKMPVSLEVQSCKLNSQ